jgi:hypothetical protein
MRTILNKLGQFVLGMVFATACGVSAGQVLKALDVEFDPTGTNLNATNMQEAITEVASNCSMANQTGEILESNLLPPEDGKGYIGNAVNAFRVIAAYHFIYKGNITPYVPVAVDPGNHNDPGNYLVIPQLATVGPPGITNVAVGALALDIVSNPKRLYVYTDDGWEYASLD